MKVKIKDLESNPFRDMKNYPINPEKVESLANSINQTGFWDNILARKKDGKIEIAYGHHRLIVLQRNFKPDHIVDIPVKDLDDATMIKIMANENMQEWETNPAVLHETIKATKKFLEEHPEEVMKLDKKRIKLPIGGFSVKQTIIARFLGWPETRIRYSLDRLEAIEADILDKEAIESMPTDYSARDFKEAVDMSGANKETQRKVAKKIVESRKKETEAKGIFGKYRMEEEMFKEEHGEDQKKREETLKREREEERRQFEYHLTTLGDKARSLWHSLVNLLEFRDILLSDHYQKSREAQNFVYWIAESFSVFRLLMGQDKQGKQIPENIKATIKMCTEGEGRADEKQRSRKATESLKLLLASKNEKEEK